MNHSKKYILIFFVFTVFISFNVMKLQNLLSTKYLYEPISVRYRSDGVTSRELEAALNNRMERGNQMPPEITAWTYVNKAEILNNRLNRRLELPMAVVNGNMLYTIPMDLVDGNYPYKDDLSGCIVDVNTAFQLFGGNNVIGNIIEYDNKEYCIRGVVTADRPVFMIQGDSQELKFNNLELMFDEKENQDRMADDFLMQYGLGSDYLIIDGNVYYQGICSIFTIPVWILYLWLAILMIRKFKGPKIHKYEWQKILAVCAGFGILILVGFILFHLLGSPLYMPIKYIPTKWSDFDHWSSVMREILNTLQQIRYLVPNPKDILLLDIAVDIKPNMILSAGMVIILGVFIERLIKSVAK